MADHYSSVGYPKPVGDENKLPPLEGEITPEQSADIAALSDWPSLINDEATTVAAGSIVRISTAGHFVLAQADTTAHATGIAGVTTAAVASGAAVTVRPIPFSGLQFVKMDCVPVDGQPVYLSATVAGKGSHTPSAIGLLPLATVSSDASALTDYGANVSPFVGLSESGDRKQILAAETVRDLGGDPKDWDHYYQDFSIKPATLGTNYRDWSLQGAVSMTTPSYLTLSAGGGSALAFNMGMLPAGVATATPWRWSMRAKFEVTAGLALFYFATDSGTAFGAGVFQSVSATKIQLAWGSENPQAGAALSTRHEIGTVVAAGNQVDMESDGLGHIRGRVDNGSWSEWYGLGPTDTGGNYAIMIAQSPIASVLDVDWVYVARKIR